ncbi:hypothetical protein [Rhodocaloribacter sp.]
MKAREYLEKHLRWISNDSIGWERLAFTEVTVFEPVSLVDAAVDIAWDRLMPPGALERPALDVFSRDGMIVFRLCMEPLTRVLAKAA